MSLVRLLTDGKSLVGIKAPLHRYRETRGGWLPKFGGAKNPLMSTGASEPKPIEGAIPAESKAKAVAVIPVFKKAQPLPRWPVEAKAASQVTVVRKLTSGAKSAGKWLAAMNPFSVATGKAVSGARMAAPIQGELSLDKVKVVRNDLRDADLEVVPLRSSAAKVALAGATSTDDNAWGQLSSNSGHAERVQSN